MPDQKMVYDAVEEMAKACNEAANQLLETRQRVEVMRVTIQGGMIGEAGNEMDDALGTKLAPAIQRIAQDFFNLQVDLLGAVAFMRGDVDSAESRFL